MSGSPRSLSTERAKPSAAKPHRGHWSSHEVRVADESTEAAGDRNRDAYRPNDPGDSMQSTGRCVSCDPERGCHQQRSGGIADGGDRSRRVTPRKVFRRIEALRGCPPKTQREGDRDDQRRGPCKKCRSFADRHASEPGDHLDKCYHRCMARRSTVPLGRLHCIPAVTDAPASRRLDNGLVMHALEARHAPVVSLWVWYQVGGRNEVPGTTGMSHFLEHMLFKGTPRHPKGDLDKLLARYGALWNAFTSEDVTCYFETVPAERYPVALELESDRMRNALITVEETEAERNVIVSEREGLENDPSFLLGEQLQAVAFSRHPYAQGVIGSKDEIKLMTRDGLYAHYRRHYAPNNAYFIVAGDAPASELLDRAAAAFGPLDAEAPIEPPKAPEPPQYGERRVVVRRAGGALPIIQVGHKAPRAADPRAPALSALAVTLAGATAGGGEAASGRSARLYRALVDTGLATTVDVSFQLMKDPYLFVVEAHLRPGVTHDRVQRVILDELEKVARSAVTDSEFGRVRRQMLAASAFMTDTITWRAWRFGQLLATGAAASLGEWYDRLAAVTAEDVRAAAESVFQEKGRTVGWFVPEQS